VEERDLGVVQVAPLPVRLWPAKIREPDIFFFAKEHTDRIGEHVCGVPDLLVEVTSPSTARLDRMEKFAEYEAGGVREYWLVDPEARQADFYVLGPDGRYDRRRRTRRGYTGRRWWRGCGCGPNGCGRTRFPRCWWCSESWDYSDDPGGAALLQGPRGFQGGFHAPAAGDDQLARVIHPPEGLRS
jgi:hypothetical protein